MKSIATAVWEGGLKDGKGRIDAVSRGASPGAFTGLPYSFTERFEGTDGPGTTPEQLIAAAHAACFAMATSSELGKAGFPPVRLTASSTVTMQPVDGKPTVILSALVLEASVPGIDDETFARVVAGSKTGCPISRLLQCEITLDARLV